MITKIAKRFKPTYLETWEDLIQWGYLGYLKGLFKANCYNKKYLKKYIKYEIMHNQLKPIKCINNISYTPKEKLQDYIPKLNKIETKLIKLLLMNYTITEISKLMNYSRTSIYKMRTELYNKIKESNA